MSEIPDFIPDSAGQHPFTYVVRKGFGWMFDETKALEVVRRHRDILIKQSDFIMLGDVQIDPEIKEQWITYRQQLRDFPETCNLRNPIWPVKPVYKKLTEVPQITTID